MKRCPQNTSLKLYTYLNTFNQVIIELDIKQDDRMYWGQGGMKQNGTYQDMIPVQQIYYTYKYEYVRCDEVDDQRTLYTMYNDEQDRVNSL